MVDLLVVLLVVHLVGLQVDLLVVLQVVHLVDLHLEARQDILDILRMVLHTADLPIMDREDPILDHLAKGILRTQEVRPTLVMVTTNTQGTLDPQGLLILKPHLLMEALPMEVRPIHLQVDILEVPRIPHQVDTHPHLAKVIHHMVSIQDLLVVVTLHPLSIIKAIPHHRRRDMDNTEVPILQVQEVKWVHLIPEVHLDHLVVPLDILANILVMIKPGEAILVIQVVHLDLILDLGVLLLLEHQVVLLVLVHPDQHPQVVELHPHLDLQQELHPRPQFPVRLNKNRILKIIIIITICLLAFSISYNHTIFDLVYLLQITLNLIFLEKNLVSSLLLQSKDCNFSMKIFLMKKCVFNFDFFCQQL